MKKKEDNNLKNKKLSFKAYLYSRRNAFFRMLFFSFLAFVFYKIGKVWRESFFYTIRFLYPLSVMAALFQLVFFLPKWSFLKPRVKKLLKKIGTPIGEVLLKCGRAIQSFAKYIGSFGDRFRRNQGEERKKQSATGYRDESFYAKKQNSFWRRNRHLRLRDMKSNGEKIRYYYMKYVLGEVRKGAPFAYHLTPAQLKSLWKNPEESEPLVGLYYEARYGTRAIKAEEVELVKK